MKLGKFELAEGGTTVVVTTHYLDEAEYCDRVTIMVDGRIDALDTPGKLKEKYKIKDNKKIIENINSNSFLFLNIAICL